MEIIINPIGGLANRMRAIASGISLSNELKLDVKEIAWPINSDLYCPFHELFEPIPGITVRSISNHKQLFLYDQPRKKNFFLSKLIQHNRYCGKVVDSHQSIETVISTHLESYKPLLIQSGVVFYDFTDELYRSLFVPHKQILENVVKRLENHKNIIGLHIRRTDNSISIEKSPIELFEEAIVKELDNDSNVRFYLATDDDFTKQLLKNKFGNDVILCSNKTAERHTEEGIKEALIELLILSRCRKIYGSYWSSFSEAAAILGNIELKQLSIDYGL